MKLALSPAAATRLLDEGPPEPIADWGRLAFQRLPRFGTEVGGFAAEGVEPELAEARDLWARIHGGALPSSQLIEALNQPAGRCLTPEGPRVLSWGTWAASLQRHICHRLLETDGYLRNVLGLPDDAQARIAEYDRQWAGLVLYPFVPGLRWDHGGIELESFGDLLRTAVRTAARRPELLTAAVWNNTVSTTRYAVIRRRMPDPRPWFAAPVPAGTAYEAARRLAVLPATSVSALRARDPWSYALAERTVAEKFGKKPTPDQIREVFGARSDYDSHVLSWMADAAGARSPERTRLLGEICRLQADQCIHLAEHLIPLKRDEEAAQALRRAFDAADDRVWFANNALFLVRYYYDRGRTAEAERVAADAAGTGSGGGLETLGLLLEWQGRTKEAEESFNQIERRYQDATSLMGFYRRMIDRGHADYESRFQELARRVFPRGMEKLDPGGLTTPPGDGVWLWNPSEDGELAGLQEADIVVAVDGWRVHGEPQYEAVTAFDHRPEMRLHVWRRGRGIDVPVRVMGRRLPFWVGTYPSKPPS